MGASTDSIPLAHSRLLYLAGILTTIILLSHVHSIVQAHGLHPSGSSSLVSQYTVRAVSEGRVRLYFPLQMVLFFDDPETTQTPTFTATPSVTEVDSATATPSETSTYTFEPPTNTVTHTSTPSVTSTPTEGTETPGATYTPTPVPTSTPTPTPTPTQDPLGYGSVFYDTFTDTETTLLKDHLPDNSPSGITWAFGNGLNNFKIDSGNRAYLFSSQNSAHMVTETYASDAILTCTITSGATSNSLSSRDAGIVFRWANEMNYWKAGINQYAGKLRITQVQNGVESLRAEINLTVGSAAHKMEVRLESTSITATLDDEIEIRYTSTFNQNATRHGITGRQQSTDLFDDFRVQVLGAANAPSNLPPVIDELMAWFHAGQVTSMRQTIGGPPPQAGDPVMEWRDLSGHGNHAYTLYTTLSGQFADDGSYPYVRFLGGENGERKSALGFVNNTDKDSWAVFLVMRLDPVTLSPNPKIIRLSADEDSRWDLSWLRQERHLWSRNNLPYGGDELKTAAVQDDGAWHLVTVSFDVGQNQMLMRVDGQLAGTDTNLFGWPDQVYDALLGAKEPGGADACPAGLHEVRIYSPARTGAQIEQIEAEMWP